MKRSNRARVIAAAGAVTFIGGTFFSSLADASTYSWGATPATNIMNTASNWTPTTSVPQNADFTFFGPSSQTSLSLSGNLSFFAATFNSDAPAYTLGDIGSTNSIQFGSTAPAGGTLTNNSSNIQTFNAAVWARVATINAASGDFVFNGAFNIGNNPNNNNGRNATITGSHNVTFNGPIIGSLATSTAPPSDTSSFGQLIMNGTSVLSLNGDSGSTYTGRIVVNSGIVRASVPNAFGANGTFTFNTGTVVAGTTHVSGAANTGRVELTGDQTFAPEILVLEGRAVSDTQLANFSGNNTWQGPVNLATGGGSYAISSDAGLLTISGNVVNTTGGAGIRTVAFRGASSGIVTGNIVEGTGSSNLSPFKDGTGTWTFTGSNTYSGVTTVSAGTLQIGAGTTSGSLGTGSVSMTGGNLVFNRSDNVIVSNPIGGASGSVIQSANSLLTFNGNLTYQGSTVVQAGTLAVSTAKTGGGAFVVADSAALTLNATSPSTTLAMSALTVGGTNGSTINFALGTSGNPTLPVVNAGALMRDGNNVLNILGSNFTTGTIALIQYAGTESGTGGFTLGALPNRVLANLVDTGSELDLQITGIDFPKWTGAVNNNWDTTMNSNPKDWVLNSNGTTPTDYIEGDSVLFDDSSSVNDVSISATVSPNAITVNNSLKNYTFSGGGGISGAATLTKTGTGTLTIANSGVNDFTGAISIGAGGTLAVGNGGTSGSLGSGTITNNGMLVLNRTDGATLANAINGSGNIQVNANTLATLSGSSNFDGVVTVQPGAALAITNANALGSTVGATVVQDGASLFVGNGGGITFAAEPMTIGGAGTGSSPGAIHAAGSVTSTFTGSITLNSSVTLFAEGGATGISNGAITGPSSDITVTGGGAWILAGSNTYANSVVSQGTLQIGNGGTSGTLGSGSVSIAGGATLSINRSDAITVPNVISGDGILYKDGNGTLNLTANNTFTGSVILNRGVLRVTNNNTIFGTGDKTIIADSRNRGIELDGGVTLPSSISLTLSNDGDLTQAGATVPFAVHSMTGSNTINSPISLKIGGGNALLSVDAGGTLTVNGTMSIQPGQGGRSIQFGGAGNGFVNGVISDGSILDPMGFQIAGAGQPTWTINSANTCTANISLQSGTLILMNSQALGFTSSGSFLNQAGTFCFIGNGGAAFAGVPAALNIGTDGLTVPNQLWTNRDGAGPLQAPNAESTERFITFSGASGTGTFSGTLLINGGVTFKSTPSGTLVMSGVLQNGTEAFATGGRNDVFIQSAGTVVFSGNNTYTGFTELDSGTLLLTNATAQNLIITGAGANGLPGGADIRGGRMVFDYGASGSGDPLPNIRPLLQTALAANFATGQFRVGNATPGIGIAYIDDTVGQKLQLLRTYLGDANTDGKVNALDFNALATNYGATGAAVWQQGDFNYDGSVDTLDFNQLAGNFNQSLAAPPAPGLGTLVPEPASLLLVPLAGLLMSRKRRDKGV